MADSSLNVLYEWTSGGVDCRIVRVGKAKNMTRGESWNKNQKEWLQWLQSTEANAILDAVEASRKAEKERDEARAEVAVLKAQRATEG